MMPTVRPGPLRPRRQAVEARANRARRSVFRILTRLFIGDQRHPDFLFPRAPRGFRVCPLASPGANRSPSCAPAGAALAAPRASRALV